MVLTVSSGLGWIKLLLDQNESLSSFSVSSPGCLALNASEFCSKLLSSAHSKLAPEVLREAGQGQLNLLTHNVLNEEAFKMD